MGILQNTGYLLLSRYLVMPLSIATGILLARVLGPEELGKYALMIWMPAVFAGPMSLGLGNANLYFGAKDRSLGPSLAANSFVMSLVFSLLVIVLVYGASGLEISKLPLGLTATHFLVPLLDLPFRLATMFTLNLLNAWEDHASYRLTEVTQTVSYFIFCFTAVFAFDLALWGFIGAQIAASTVTSLYAIRCLRQHQCLSLRVDLALLRRSIGYGMKVQVGSIVRVTGQKLDELILLYFVDVRALGLLTLARNLTNRFRVIPYSLGTVISTRLSISDQQAFTFAATAARRMTLVMLGLVVVAVIAVGPLIPLVYGHAYTDAVTPVRIFLLMLIPIVTQRVFTVFLLAVGQMSVFLQSVAIGVITVVLLDFALIPAFGVIGAAVASVLAMTIEAYYVGRAFVRHSAMSWVEVLLPTMDDVAYFITMSQMLLRKARIRA